MSSSGHSVCRTLPAALRDSSNSRVLHQSIAHGRFGQNVPGLRRVVLEFLPQMSHIYAHVVSVLGMRGPPYLAQDLSMREDFAGIGDQETEQPILDRRQMYRRVPLVRRTQTEVDFDVAEREHRARTRIATRFQPPPRGSANAGQRFPDAERLGQIVIGTCIQRSDLTLLTHPRGQDDDGYLRPSATLAQT